MSLKDTYIQFGVPSNWAHEYELTGIPAATFKVTSKKNLLLKYQIPENQIKFVKHCLVRQPIDEAIVQKLLQNSKFVCCLCQGQKSNAFIIHHIIEYSISQDNTYSNLAVVCPNDHDLAHRSGIALTSKISEKQIRAAKINWEKQVINENKAQAINKPLRGKIKDWKEINPYKELQSYTEGDKEYFFGRKIEITELLARINKFNIVGLFGESGTGKTSLVNAGLIPNFKKEGFITVSVRCLDEPIKRVREELLKTFKEKKIAFQLVEELAITDTFAHLIVQLKLIVEKEDINLIIVIDQFEEIFTRAKEEEREHLAKGITESLATTPIKGKIYFLLSLREDYIGELWDWAHLYNLEDAWIQMYRIKRLNAERANEAIVQPLHKLGIKTDNKFVLQLISELRQIGDDLIYPPYLQIVCSELFEEYKKQNFSAKPIIEFGQNLYKGIDTAESIIANYLSESMLEGLTEGEKLYAQNILDLLTGTEGLRTFLKIEDISRYLNVTIANAQHVIEHLIKKKIVHPLVEDDKVTGYELVHDFLSKKFFEKLGPEAKRAKTTIELFRQAFREWEQHGVLASKDRLEMLFPNFKQLILNDEEWTFLIKSSFSVYWHRENQWILLAEKEKLANICVALLTDNKEEIVKRSIETLSKIKGQEATITLKQIIESSETSDSIKESAIDKFAFDIIDIRILETLKYIITKEKKFKLRKSAVYALGKNLSELSKLDENIIDGNINIIFEALDDSMIHVRKQAADVLSYILINDKSVAPLIARLKKESSILSRKAIVSALGSLMRHGKSIELISSIFKKIVLNKKENFKVREEARLGLDA